MLALGIPPCVSKAIIDNGNSCAIPYYQFSFVSASVCVCVFQSLFAWLNLA